MGTSSGVAWALPLIPMTYNGSLSYYYIYSKADKAESETATLSGTFNGNGFVWQPWFISLGVGVSVGLTESNSNYSGNGDTSTVTSGELNMTVFPRSRFPFMLAISRTDSRLNNSLTSFSSDNHYINYRYYLSQAYYGINGSLARLSWDHNQFESELSDSKSDTVSATYRGRARHHRYSIDAGYTEVERSGSDAKPSSSRLEAQHNYSPGTELSVNSSASYTRNDSDLSGGASVFETVQATSVFGWRPIDRPYSITGGARIATSDSGSSVQSKSMSTNIGTAYRLTRSVRIVANALVSASETGDSQTVTTSENASMNYFSQQYLVGGFNWGWNSDLGFSNSDTKVDDTSDNQQSKFFNIGHNFNRNWALSRFSTFSFTFTENGSVSDNSDQDKRQYGLGHGLTLGWSRRGLSSATYSNVTITDTRTAGETTSSYQQLYAQLTQRNILTRVSSLSASITYQATNQDIQDAINDQPAPRLMTANAVYTNSRAFGVYALQFSTRLTYHKRLDEASFNSETTESESRLDYHIGLLTTGLSYRIMQVAGGALSENINFSLTRTF